MMRENGLADPLGAAGCCSAANAMGDAAGGSGIAIRSGAGSGVAGGSAMVFGSGNSVGCSGATGSDGGVSCEACMRANGVIGIGPLVALATPLGDGDWIDLKKGSARRSFAGRPISALPRSVLGAVPCGAPAGSRSPRNRLDLIWFRVLGRHGSLLQQSTPAIAAPSLDVGAADVPPARSVHPARSGIAAS
jgi:hypothetical protein